MAVHIRLLTAVVLPMSVLASPGVPLHNCSREYDVELSKDNHQLEVCHKNELGGVCNWDGTFDETAARVVCYQLNRSGENATLKNCTNQLVPNKVWWTDVECLGTDESFESCKKTAISECSDFFYVCVTCPEESELRLRTLVGEHFENANYGRLQIYFNNTWSEICVKESAHWSKENGQVVCEELGLGGCKSTSATGEEHFQHSPNFIMSEDMMNCTGNESSIKDCKTTPWREVPREPQTTYYYIQVVCMGPEIKSPQVTPTGPHSVNVKWSIDQAVLRYPIVTEYQIQYTQHGMKVINHPATDSTHYSVEVDGLKHNTEYNFTIQAKMMPFNDTGPKSTVTGKTASLPDSSGLEVGLSVGLGVGLIILILVIVSISCLVVVRKRHGPRPLQVVPGGGGINVKYGAVDAHPQENSGEQPRDEDPPPEGHPGSQHHSLPGYISA